MPGRAPFCLGFFSTYEDLVREKDFLVGLGILKASKRSYESFEELQAEGKEECKEAEEESSEEWAFINGIMRNVLLVRLLDTQQQVPFLPLLHLSSSPHPHVANFFALSNFTS